MSQYRDRLDLTPIPSATTGEETGTYGYAIVPVTIQGLIGGEVSGPSRIEKALMDTGATDSAIHPALIRDLALRQLDLGQGPVSALGADVMTEQTKPEPVYHVRLTIADIGEWDPYVNRRDFPERFCRLFRVIIGTDILQACRFRVQRPRRLVHP
jgi:hypothetical protein